MIYAFFNMYPYDVMAIGALVIYILTIIDLKCFMHKLPCDEGRDFAVDGKKSKGKPRGAGIIFVGTFILGMLLFSPINWEYLSYIFLIFVEMMTGYLDDSSEKPWSRLTKGLLDLFVALSLGAVFLYYNDTNIFLGLTGKEITVHPVLFYILTVALVWISINVTNCADGIDGLSGTLTIVSIMSFYMTDLSYIYVGKFAYMIIYFVSGLLAYLWFNASPSILLMGDAGSRAMGVFLAITAIKSHMPLLYIPFCLVLLVDGGIGLFKVSCIKIFKFNPLVKIRTPLHDHVRKNLNNNWSNHQCVMRFCIIQIVVSLLTLLVIVR